MRHLTLLSVLLCAFEAHAQALPPGFQPLFSGNELSGWETLDTGKANLTLKDGLLSFSGSRNPVPRLVTYGQYDDFELRLDYQVSKKGQATLTIRTAGVGSLEQTGLAIVLQDDGAFPKAPELQVTGALRGIAAPTKRAGKAAGEWNSLHLIVNDRKLTLTLNGVKVQEVDLDELFQKKKAQGLERQSGRIGLSVYSGETRFREVSVKDLGAANELGKVTLALETAGHLARVGRVLFSPDGKQIYTGSTDNTIRVWDAATGQQSNVLRPPGVGDLAVMALSPDGKTLAVASRYFERNKFRDVIFLIRPGEGAIERVLEGHKERILGLAYSADGKRLVSSAEDQSIRVWNPATGKTETTIPTKLVSGGTETVRGKGRGDLALSPTGDRLAYVDGAAWTDGHKAFVVEIESSKVVAEFGNRGISGIAWSPDGKTIATAGVTSLWDTAGKELPRPAEMPQRSMSVRFGRDGRLLVTWNANPYHRATVFDLAKGKEVSRFVPSKSLVKGYNPPANVRDGDISLDGNLAATVGNGHGLRETLLWKTSDGKIVHRLAAQMEPQGRAAWSKDGKSVGWPAGRGKTSATFNLASLSLEPDNKQELIEASLKEGELTLEFQEPGKRYWERQVVNGGEVVTRLGVPHWSHKPVGATFIGPGQVAMSGDWGGFFLYDSATGKRIHQYRDADGVFRSERVIASAAASPDKARLMCTTGVDHIRRIWKPERQRPLLMLYVSGSDWIVWTEEGYYAATPGGERLMGWKVDNGIDQMPSFYPAEQFRKQLYRPDVIKLVFEKGSVEEALKIANAATGIKQEKAVEVEKLLPPGVTITVDQSKLPVVTVKVQARAAVAEQPIKSLRLMVDGLRLPDGQAAVSFESGKEQAEYETSWTVKLPPGPHKLSVLALSRDYTPNLSNQVAVRCPAVGNERPAIHHLAVGVSKYRTVTPDLKYADKDARDLKSAILASTKKGLAYRPGLSLELLNKDAVSDAILHKIDDVRNTAQPGDLFVLSFAGHGVRDGGEFFLLTHEADQRSAETLKKTAISGTALREKLATFPCQVLLFLDACHSGGAVGGLPGGSDDAARSLSDVDLRIAVMCAALGHEKAKEESGNGLFTASVIRALNQDKEAFYDRSTGEMTVHHLMAFVEQEVRKKSDGLQNPYLKMPLAHPAFTVTQFAQMSSRIER